MPLEQVWTLAKAWYAGRLEPSWTPRTLDETARVFAAIGLTDDFWRVT